MTLFESVNSSLYDIGQKSVKEALPSDLMKAMKGSHGGYPTGKVTDTYSSYNPDKVWDFANASYEELTRNQLKLMAQNGEDLSGIFILTKDGGTMELDSQGRVIDSSGFKYPKSDRKLTTTLRDAAKIYKVDLKTIQETDPEKAKLRLSDPRRRLANRELGKSRLPYAMDVLPFDSSPSTKISGHNRYNNYILNDTEYNKADARARNRYYDSEVDLQQRIGDFKRAKRALAYYEDRLKRFNNHLSHIVLDDRFGDSDEYPLSLKTKIDILSNNIKELQQKLDKYQSMLDNGAEEDKLSTYELDFKDTQAKVAAAKNEIDRIMRRNEALVKKSNKRLNESREYWENIEPLEDLFEPDGMLDKLGAEVGGYCSRGERTGASTYKELGEYVVDLGNKFVSIGTKISSLNESLKKKSNNNTRRK